MSQVIACRSAVPVALALALAAALACGCTPTAKADRDATPADLALAAESVGLQPEGGLPESVRVTLTNRSAQTVAVPLPLPMAPKAKAPEGAATPLPLLVAHLRSAQGREESAIWTDPKRGSWPKAKTVVLAPGETWSETYTLDAFYFWGPTGPDARGAFTQYFWRGESPLVMTVMMVFAEGRLLRADPIGVTCKFEDWLFQTQRTR
jgi:hypothetical protein